MLLLQTPPSAPCPGFLPQTAAGVNVDVSYPKDPVTFCHTARLLLTTENGALSAQTSLKVLMPLEIQEMEREDALFLAESTAPCSRPKLLGDPGPSVLTCPVRAPPSCSMDATRCLDPEPSSLITPPLWGVINPMVTMRRRPRGHRGALHPGWSVGMCPASLTTTLHLLLCLLGRTVGRG